MPTLSASGTGLLIRGLLIMFFGGLMQDKTGKRGE